MKVDSTEKLAELERAERVCSHLEFLPRTTQLTDSSQEKMKAKVDAIAPHGTNCIVKRQLIYNYPESLLNKKGIMVIEHADFEGMERLSLVSGGEIASTFDQPDLSSSGNASWLKRP